MPTVDATKRFDAIHAAAALRRELDLVVNRAKRSECPFTKCSRVIEAAVLIECRDRSQFVATQFEIEQRDVFTQAIGFRGSRNDGRATLHAPAKHHLRGCLPVRAAASTTGAAVNTVSASVAPPSEI